MCVFGAARVWGLTRLVVKSKALMKRKEGTDKVESSGRLGFLCEGGRGEGECREEGWEDRIVIDARSRYGFECDSR